MKTTLLAITSMGLSKFQIREIGLAESIESKRPPVEKRNFVSEAVEAKIAEIKKEIADEELAWMFENCFANTLDTTVKFNLSNGKPDTFVITGDINAMWLRDSSAQVYPYLQFINEEKKLKELIKGVINRQTKCILTDPYANSFNFEPTGSYWEKDITKMKPELHERKWEVDSLCYPVRLAYNYWKTSNDVSCFDENWLRAVKSIVSTFREQQRKTNKGSYSFKRITDVAYDTLPLNGFGNPTKPIGLIHSMFRPSDDACVYPFLIPSNLFAALSLNQIAEMVTDIWNEKTFANECRSFSDEIKNVVNEFAVTKHLDYNEVFAYEIDGFGNALFMDDANVPSLLSLPYLGICNVEEPVYKNTRRFILSEDNPYFFRGKIAEGIGSPHIDVDMIWPLSIIMRALTTNDEDEIKSCLRMLKLTHAGTGFIHESFHKDNPDKFTRSWFAWANTLFGELIIKLYYEKPELLKKNI